MALSLIMSLLDNYERIKHLIQPTEDEKQYPSRFEAFLVFASLQFRDRSIEKVSEITGFTNGTCRLWSSKNKWSERVTNIDAFRYAEEYREKQELVRADNKKYILINRQIKEKTVQASMRMLDIVHKLLDTAMKADEVQHNDYIEDKDGNIVPTTTIIKMNAKLSDAPALLNAVVRATRAVNDLPMEDREELPAFTENLEDYTVDELIAMRNENLNKIHVLEGKAN